MRQALQPSFDVRDSDGFAVGSGVVEPGETRDAVPDEDGALEAVS